MGVNYVKISLKAKNEGWLSIGKITLKYGKIEPLYCKKAFL